MGMLLHNDDKDCSSIWCSYVGRSEKKEKCCRCGCLIPVKNKHLLTVMQDSWGGLNHKMTCTTCYEQKYGRSIDMHKDKFSLWEYSGGKS